MLRRPVAPAGNTENHIGCDRPFDQPRIFVLRAIVARRKILVGSKVISILEHVLRWAGPSLLELRGIDVLHIKEELDRRDRSAHLGMTQENFGISVWRKLVVAGG